MTSTPAAATRFVAVTEQLGGLGVPLLPHGVIVGRDEQANPVAAPLFTPEAGQVALIGNWWGLGLVVFRCLGIGARVVVNTTAVDFWNRLGHTATGRDDRLLAAAEPVQLPAGTAAEPVLHVVDVAAPGVADPAPPRHPWQTRLAAISVLTAATAADVRPARLTLMQRLSPGELTVAADALRMPAADLRMTQQLNQDMFALVQARTIRYLWAVPTVVEQQIFGPAPARG